MTAPYLRVPIGGHSGPRGFEPGMIAGGWGYKQGSVSAAIKAWQPAGLVVWCPWGNEPRRNLRLSAYADCAADARFAQIAYVDGFRSCAQDWCDALRSFGPDHAALVGVYIGIESEPMTFREYADAWEKALSPFDPETTYPILDYFGSVPGAWAQTVIETVFEMGYKRLGYEDQPIYDSPIDIDDQRFEAFFSGWWWKHHRADLMRHDLRDVRHRKVVQMELGYAGATDVASITDGGAIPCPEWYVGLPAAAPTPDEKS